MNARAGTLATLITVLILISASTEAVRACSLSDIQIKRANIVRQEPSGPFPVVIGELVNGCDEATGVQLHITLRDNEGQVVSTSDPWPAGVHNIPPHSLYACTLYADADDDRPADSLQVKVTEVRQ